MHSGASLLHSVDARRVTDHQLSANTAQTHCVRLRIPGLFVGIRRKTATIASMQIAILGMRILEVMFFVGLLGSSVVVLISFVEDAKELFGGE